MFRRSGFTRRVAELDRSAQRRGDVVQVTPPLHSRGGFRTANPDAHILKSRESSQSWTMSLTLRSLAWSLAAVSKLSRVVCIQAARYFRDKYDEASIEVALTKFDCDNPNSSPLRQQLERELGDYFSRLQASDKLIADQPWVGSFVRDVFKEGDVVISLNYDCVFEGLMDLGVNGRPMERSEGEHTFALRSLSCA